MHLKIYVHILKFTRSLMGSQGRSQHHSPEWARVPLSSFFPQILINFSYFSSNFTYFLPHFGSPGGRLAHPGRPWLRHCGQPMKCAHKRCGTIKSIRREDKFNGFMLKRLRRSRSFNFAPYRRASP